MQVTDSELPDGLEIVTGKQSATYEKINPGASKKYSYTVVATKGDAPMMLGNAKVTYKAEADASELTTGTSSFTGFYVITPVQEITRHALNVVSATTAWRSALPAALAQAAGHPAGAETSLRLQLVIQACWTWLRMHAHACMHLCTTRMP